MSESDAPEATALITRTMNSDEGRWAGQTMRFHFGCRKQKLDDGRTYFVWREGKEIRGLVGLHYVLWGPEENVWLAWFAVDPEFQGRGLGGKLLRAIEEIAIGKGFRKLFVETYQHPDFDKARLFYERSGLKEVGRIANYLHDGAAMIVYAKSLR